MLNLNLQFFAHKKGVGSTKNGRDSESKRLGAKRADGQFVLAGNILYRQRIVRFIQVLMLVVVAMIHYSHLLMELLPERKGRDKKQVCLSCCLRELISFYKLQIFRIWSFCVILKQSSVRMEINMFSDKVRIFIKSGKGGDGHVSFRRELYVPAGGPDGGNGGNGGDIIFQVDKGLNTLGDFRHNSKYIAQSGEEGGKKRCTGKNGEDLIIKVPEGTVIYDDESGKVIADMSGDNMKETILKGGHGGKGNMNYATATMQAPQYAQPGQEAKELWVRLELKCIADVGLVGFPNVGKSTFLSRVTNARPKIANYHFTTLNPKPCKI